MRRVPFHDVVAERHSECFTHMLESAVSPGVLAQFQRLCWEVEKRLTK